MRWFAIKKLVFFTLIMFVTGAVLIFFDHFFVFDTKEYGSFELTQLFLLGACFVIVSMLFFYNLKNQSTRLDILFSAMLWVITAAMIGRETSWGIVYGVSHSVSDLVKIVGIVVLSAVTLAVLHNWLFYERDKIKFIFDAFRLPVVPLFIMAACFVFFGNFFEKQYFGLPYNQLLEEGYECFGYMIFLYGNFAYGKSAFSKR